MSAPPPDRAVATQEVERLVRSGQLALAADALEQQVAWWPDDGQRWANLAALYRRLKRPVRAAETLIRAFDVVPVAPYANVVTQLLADLPTTVAHRLGSAYYTAAQIATGSGVQARSSVRRILHPRPSADGSIACL